MYIGPLNKPLRLLDFGCGPGFMWDHLKGSSWHYTGLDFTAESVETLQRKAGSDPLFDGAFHITSLPAPLETGSFDLLSMIEVVEHLNDDYLAATMKEAARLLKPGGRLIISTPNAERLEDSHKFCPDCGAVFHEWQHLRNWTPETLADYVSAYGFVPIRTVTTDFGATGIRFPLYLAKRLAGRKAPHLLMVFRAA